MLSLVACPSCGKGNRLKSASTLTAGKCGSCGASLQLASAIEVDDGQLARHLKMTDGGPVLLDVWAPWCGPCREMTPHFNAAAKALCGEARLLKLNADQSAMVERLNIRSIPTLLLFRSGAETARQTGAMNAAGIIAWLRTERRNGSP